MVWRVGGERAHLVFGCSDWFGGDVAWLLIGSECHGMREGLRSQGV